MSTKLDQAYEAALAAVKKAKGPKRAKEETWQRYLYHVTLLAYLPSIARRGLQPGYRPTFSGYSGHSKGRVFLSDHDSVSCWHGKISDIVEHGDREVEQMRDDLLVPVILRIDRDPKKLEPDLKLFEDEPGKHDCPYGVSYFVKSRIPADLIEVWTGRTYRHVSHFANISDWDEAKSIFSKYARFEEEGDENDHYLNVEFSLPEGY